MFKEETPRWKKKRRIRAVFLGASLLLCGFLYFSIGGTGSNYLKLALDRLLHPVPVFNYIIFEHNGVKKRLIPDQTLHTHPLDRLKIVKIDTSVHLNRGIRLFSKGFDINALQEETVIAKLLPGQDAYRHYTYTIKIKHENDSIGNVGLVISPSVEDLLEKANRVIDPEKRLVFLRLAVREKGNDLRLKTRLADEYLALKKWEQGANIIEDIIVEKPEVSLLRRLMDAYEHLHQYRKVITTLRKILIQTPEDLEIRLKLAGLLEKQGRLKEAVKEYTIILPRLPEDERIVCMKNMGYLLFQDGQKKKALEWYLKAAKYDKKDPNLYYNIGSIYDELKRHELAEEYLRLAVDLRKDDIGGRLRLGQSLFKKGKLKEAKRYVKEILKRDPDHLAALTVLANIVEKEGDKKALKGIYRQILSHEPKNTTILFNLGVLEAEGGNVEKAIYYLETLVKIDPKDIQAREALFDIYQREKRGYLAFDQALELINLAPRKISNYDYIFKYLMEQSEFEKLAKYMLKGVKANPKSFELRQYLILAHLNLKKNDLAVKEMKEALKLKPNDIDLLRLMAKVKEEAGDLDQALKLYQKILEIFPGDEKAENAYLRLRLKLLNKGKASVQ
ncbi:MAG: tetratricopeptide repeat protein [Deltaproteobacteria bacterium]|nr:MAG: tetratricopeptide repeat protein [Deltaproteobacteria bacterium]